MLTNVKPLNTNIINKYHCYRNFNFQKQDNSGCQHTDNISNASKLAIAGFSILGTLVSLAVIRKYQTQKSLLECCKKILSVDYGLKEMLLVGAGSVLGGLAGGIVFDKKESKLNKVKEAVYQFVNIAVPTCLVAKLLAITNRNKNLNNKLSKFIAIIAGVGVGMPVGAYISNQINNLFIDNKHKYERKLSLRDCFVHIDDIFAAIILMKIPQLQGLNVGKALPALYAMCGYQSGTKR